MRYYIVECADAAWDNLFVVMAQNKQEAIDIVFEEHIEPSNERHKGLGYLPYTKKDLSAKRLEEYAEEGLKSICLN